MKTVTIEHQDLTVQDLFVLAEAEPLILTREGGAALAVIRLDEADVETWKLGQNPSFLQIIQRSRARYRDEGGIPLSEVRQRFDLAPARQTSSPK